jgi:hypothetical protein
LNTHTVCVVGASVDDAARFIACLDEVRGALNARWQLADHASADVLLVDAESVYGHMDWLKARGSGRRVVAWTASQEGYDAELWLRRPIVSAELSALLNRLGASLGGQPASAVATPPKAGAPAPRAEAVAPAAIPAAPAPASAAASAPAVASAPTSAAAAPTVAEPPLPTPAPPPAVYLLDLLGPNPPVTLANRVCLEASGLPTLYLDSRARTWHSVSTLKGLSGWCQRPLERNEAHVVGEVEFAAAVANLPGQPYARLSWLVHLLRGEGKLDPGFDANARYKLVRWPQSEREFPKHFRIGTVMLKHAATLDEIAEQCGASLGEISDFINAYHALGYIEVEASAQAGDEARRGGLFGRSKKVSPS